MNAPPHRLLHAKKGLPKCTRQNYVQVLRTYIIGLLPIRDMKNVNAL